MIGFIRIHLESKAVMKTIFSITSDIAGQKSDLDVFFRAAASAGFDAVHWCHDWIGEPVRYDDDFIQRVRALIDRYRLPVADVHSYDSSPPTEDALADERRYLEMNLNRIEFASRIGAGGVVVHLQPRKEDCPEEFFERSLEKLERMLPAARAAGVWIAVENLPNPMHTEAFFDALWERFDAREVGFCYDSGHAVITRQQHFLGQYIDRLKATHLHDNDGSGDQHLLPGLGRADWPYIAETIRSSRYAGTVNLEIGLPEGEALDERCLFALKTLKGLWSCG